MAARTKTSCLNSITLSCGFQCSFSPIHHYSILSLNVQSVGGDSGTYTQIPYVDAEGCREWNEGEDT